MDQGELLAEKMFLGQEFLTWLWFISEEEGGTTLSDNRPLSIMLDDLVVLGPVAGNEGSRITVKGRETSLAEAREGLRRGKLVESLRLGLELEGEEYWFTVKAAELAISSLKLPAAEGEMEFRIDFRELQAVPKDIRAGQMVSLRLGLDVSKLSAEARANLTASDAEDQKIGPFRVLEVGGFDPTNTAGEDISEGYIKVAVKWDDKSVERLSRAMNSRNAERLMGIFVDG